MTRLEKILLSKSYALSCGGEIIPTKVRGRKEMPKTLSKLADI